MIVSCENCKSRYKLDDSKITGRGAKITCPKCKHVFVVLAPPVAIVETPKPAAPAAAAPEWEEDEPTRVGRDLSPPPPPPAPPPAAAAPPQESVNEVKLTRTATGAATLNNKDAAARAATLDFRKVGVSAWKVKVRIGLVYDFSDIKTLRKYIQDGRVTPADVISHDGKTWKPIGEIPDLDLFFCESYDKLAIDYAEKAPAAKEPAPADLGGVAAALAAAAAAEVDDAGNGRTQSTGPVYTDPFEALKQKQKGKKAPRAQAASQSRTPTLALAAVVVLALGGGLWWAFGRTPTGGAAIAAEAATEKSKAGKTSKAASGRTPDQIRDEIEREFKPVNTTPAAPEAVAVVPENCEKIINGKCATVVRSGPSSAPAQTSKPQGTAPTGTTTQQSNTNDEGVGDDAMRSGDYDTAMTAYSKAASAGSSRARTKLGEAQMRSGDLAAAQATLTAAAQSDSRAHKLLGELKASQGDAAGAKESYERYLKSNPKDAEALAALARLSG